MRTLRSNPELVKVKKTLLKNQIEDVLNGRRKPTAGFLLFLQKELQLAQTATFLDAYKSL